MQTSLLRKDNIHHFLVVSCRTTTAAVAHLYIRLHTGQATSTTLSPPSLWYRLMCTVSECVFLSSLLQCGQICRWLTSCWRKFRQIFS